MANILAQIELIFGKALAEPLPAERAAYLDQACGANKELRGRVEQLLASAADAGSFMAPPDSKQTFEPVADVHERSGSKIGRYKLLEQIGEGGFGVVFLAEQEEPVRRKIALKIIKLGMDTKQVVARFEAERQALAMMDHPNIAKIFDAGSTDSGRPYFVMELVRGIRINEYCDQHSLGIHQRLELFVQVCRAVQHAHQKGIIHRDIKPSNIMVTVNDGRPTPKVIDFGVAKAIDQPLTERTLFTAFSQMVGTPLYMSPEQAEMTSLDIDTRSDIYSLGVLLYELLTGTTPFDQLRMREAAFDEMRRIIREEEPPRPSMRISTMMASRRTVAAARRQIDSQRLTHLLRGDLDWVVMKSLNKDRMRRYDSAAGLARDIERYLHDEEVEACPPSAGYRVRKFMSRHRRAVTAAMAFVLLLVVATVTSALLYARAESQRRLADSRERIAQQARAEAEGARTATENSRKQAELATHETGIELQRARLIQVQLELATGDMVKARSLLLLPVDPSLEEEWHWRAWEYARKSRIVNCVNLTPAGETFSPARTGGKGLLTFTNGQLVADVSPYRHKEFHLELDTRQNQTTAQIAEDAARYPGRYAAVYASDGAVEIREGDKPAVVDSFPGTGEDVVSFAFDAGGRRLYGMTGDWYVVTWVWSPSGWVDLDIKDTQTEQARHMQFTSDGRRLAIGCYGDVVEVWDAMTHALVQVIHAVAHPVPHHASEAVLTSDGQTLFETGWEDPVIRIWRVSDASLIREIKRDQWAGSGLIRLILKSDGKSLYAEECHGARARIELLNAQDGTTIASSALLPEDAFSYAIALSEKYNRLFVCLHPTKDPSDSPEHRRCLILDATTLQTVGMLPDAHAAGLRDIHLSSDGSLLALCSRDGTATIWDWQRQRLLHRLEAKPGLAHSNIISSVRFHPSAPVVATACHDNRVIFWSANTGRPLAEINIDEHKKLGYGTFGILKEIAFSPDGKTLVITVKDKLWWLDLSCYDQAIANLKAERDKPRNALSNGVPRA